MYFLAFLIAAFSILNAALLLAESDNSDLLQARPPLPGLPLHGSLLNPNSGDEYLPLPGSLLNTNLDNNDLPLPDSLSNSNLGNKDLPIPGSLSNPKLGNEYLPVPDLLSLNLPAPGNEPINLNLNPFHSETLADKPTFSPETAQEPSINGAEDAGESSIVPPPIIDAQTQTNTDDFHGMCISDSSTGRKRRRGQSSCRNPAMFELRLRVPPKPKAGRTKAEETNDQGTIDDIKWVRDLLRKRFGPARPSAKESETEEYWNLLAKARKDACITKSQKAFSYVRPFPLCCIGPSQDVIVQAKLRLARRQNINVVTNWFNCNLAIPERPICNVPGITNVCCVGFRDVADRLFNIPEAWWRWGYKGADCVETTFA